METTTPAEGSATLNQRLKKIVKSSLRAVLPKSVYDRLVLANLRYRKITFVKRVVRHRYGEMNLNVSIEEPVAESWYDRDWDQLEEIRVLREKRLKAGKTVFDVGAHQGVVAMLLANEVSPGGKVVAVEASPFNARVLRENLRLNEVNNVILENIAIADRPGKLTMNEDSNGQVDSTQSMGAIEISALTVDDLREKHGQPDVVFVDIEGFECAALRGAKRTLEGKTDWFVEVHVAAGLEKLGGSIAEVLSHFPENRFETSVASGHVEAGAFRRVDRAFFSSKDPLLEKRFFLIASALG